jgi:Short C-terminal domain
VKIIYRFLSYKFPGIDKHTAEQADAFIRQGIRGEGLGQQSSNTQNYTYRTQDPLDKLAKLADLKQKGAITDEEFQRLKTELLGNYKK